MSAATAALQWEMEQLRAKEGELKVDVCSFTKGALDACTSSACRIVCLILIQWASPTDV